MTGTLWAERGAYMLVSRAWLRRAAGLSVRLQLTETELTRALQTGSTSASDVIQRAAAMVTAAGGQRNAPDSFRKRENCSECGACRSTSAGSC